MTKKKAPTHPWAAHLFHNISPVTSCIWNKKNPEYRGHFISLYITNPNFMHYWKKIGKFPDKKMHQKNHAHQLWGPPQTSGNPWNFLGEIQPETQRKPGNLSNKPKSLSWKLEPILHVLRGKRGKFVDTPKVSLSKYHMYTYCICRYVC